MASAMEQLFIENEGVGDRKHFPGVARKGLGTLRAARAGVPAGLCHGETQAAPFAAGKRSGQEAGAENSAPAWCTEQDTDVHFHAGFIKQYTPNTSVTAFSLFLFAQLALAAAKVRMVYVCLEGGAQSSHTPGGPQKEVGGRSPLYHAAYP